MQDPDVPPTHTQNPFDDSLYRWSATGHPTQVPPESGSETAGPTYGAKGDSTYKPPNVDSAPESTAPPSEVWEQPDNRFMPLEDEEEDLFGDDPANETELDPSLHKEPTKDAPHPAASFLHESNTPQASTSGSPATTQDKGKAPEKRAGDLSADNEPTAKRRKIENEPVRDFTGLPEIFRDKNFYPMWRGTGTFEKGFFADEERYDPRNVIIIWDNLAPLLRKSYIVTVGAWIADDRNFTNMPLEWVSDTRKFWAAVSDRWANEEACAKKKFPMVVGAYLFNLYHFNHRLVEIGKAVQVRADNGGTPPGFGGDYPEAVAQQEEYEWEEMERREAGAEEQRRLEEERRKREEEQQEREQKRLDRAFRRQYYIDTSSDDVVRIWLQKPVTGRREDLTHWLQEHSERLESIDRTDSAAAAEMMARDQQIEFLTNVSARGHLYLEERHTDVPGAQEADELQAEWSPAADTEAEVDDADYDAVQAAIAKEHANWAKHRVEEEEPAGPSASQAAETAKAQEKAKFTPDAASPGKSAPSKTAKDEEVNKLKADVRAKKTAVSDIIAEEQTSRPVNEPNMKKKKAAAEESPPEATPKKKPRLKPKKGKTADGEEPEEPKKKKEPKPRVRCHIRMGSLFFRLTRKQKPKEPPPPREGTRKSARLQEKEKKET